MEATSRIYIHGLPPSLTAEEFRKHFGALAPITDAKFIQHRRIGYVGYKTPQDAARAVKYHNKSFIRMSRIGVELARPIEKQQVSKPGKTAANRPVHVVDGGRDGNIARGGSFDSSVNNNVKESERQEIKDVKLQEYLQAMQQPSKTKAWEEDALLSPQRPIVSMSNENDAAKDGGSDGDDYDELPRKRRKTSNEPSHVEKAVTITSNMQSENNSTDEKPEERDHMEAMQSDLPAATDEDWLRSRKNRVLDLETYDDPPTIISQQDKHEKANDHDENESGKEVREISSNTNLEVSRSVPSPDVSLEDKEVDQEYVNNRLFLRNLPYTANTDDLYDLFGSQGFNGVVEVHLPMDSKTGQNKGFAHVEFQNPDIAAEALTKLDQTSFQGRLLHIIPSLPKKESGMDEFEISKLPLKKQQQMKRKAEAGKFNFNWNSMFMNSDAVISSVSSRLGVSKSELLDPSSSGAAIRQAQAETHVIQEVKAFFTSHGVNLDAFKKRNRGDIAILVKNFPFDTKEQELRSLFESYGPLRRFLIPEAGTIAIVEFENEDHAKSAFRGLAYRKLNGSVLFLEKAPKDLFGGEQSITEVGKAAEPAPVKSSITELLEPDQSVEAETSTLYVRNLNFSTDTKRLSEAFRPLDGFLSARVQMKPNAKASGQPLSMGFGFVEFRHKEQAQAALLAMQGHKLEGYELVIRPSHRTVDAAEERRKADRAKKLSGRKTKIIIKNLPFEATKKDVRSLFGTYGQLRSVRAPKKFDGSTRGFAFADFVTAREAENAMDALRDTHLLGRRLVLEFASTDTIDPEVEIAQMQQKVGRQADKVALQKLTGTGRKKFTVEGADEELG